MSEQLVYHKKTFFPSSYLAAQFYNFNSEQIYFSSGNKLILFDVIKNVEATVNCLFFIISFIFSTKARYNS